MKKIISVILILTLLSGFAVTAFAGDTIYCWNCGIKIPADSNFCPYCAAKQNAVTSFGTGTENIQVGDTLLFGTYEQDNNVSNGPEPIEWQVLQMSGNTVLLLSRKVLEYLPFDSVPGDFMSYWSDFKGTTWDTCDLRNWLNTDFYNSSFTREEQTQIVETYLNNKEYSYAYPGENTRDKIFVLSISEVKELLPQKSDRVTVGTKYAASMASVTTEEYMSWCLRNLGFPIDDMDPDSKSDFVVDIFDDGSFSIDNEYFTDSGGMYYWMEHGIRPALWIKIK